MVVVIDINKLNHGSFQDDTNQETRNETDWWLKNILFDLCAAGHDTTSNTLSWAMLLMVNNPEVQVKVQQELDQVLGARIPSYGDRESLPYTEATIHEIMRIQTLVPMALPHMTSKDMDLDGFFLPRGTFIFPQLQMVHENPAVFQGPHNFDPARFLDPIDGSFVLHPNWIPFGVGRRRCTGEALARVSVFLFFTRILQKFQIKHPEGPGRKLPEEAIFGLSTMPKPFKVILEPRIK